MIKIALLLLSAAALLAQGTKDLYPRTLNGLTAAQINALTPAARMFVVQTDSLSASCSGAMTGGGSTYCIVLYNGSSWAYAGGAGSGGSGLTYTPVRNGTTTILDLPAITTGTMAVGTLACGAVGTATVTASSGTGTVWVALASDCTVVARHNIVAACSANCTAVASSSGFDPTDLPLYQWTVTSGVFAATGTNKLIPNMSVPLVAGANVVLATAAGVTTISAAASGGDVVGPASATNNNLAAFDGTTGKLIEDSGLPSASTGTGSIVRAIAPTFAGSNDTATFYNSADRTKVIIRAGPNDTVGSDHNLAIQNTGGTTVAYFRADGTVAGTYLLTADNVSVAVTDQTAGIAKPGVNFDPISMLTWSSGTQWWAGSKDTGIARNAAGVVEINSGTAGTYRDLRARAVIGTLTTPASASAACTAGTAVWDANFIYVCTATDTWKRIAIATW